MGLKPHRLYGASNWLGSKPHPITSPSLPLSLTPSLLLVIPGLAIPIFSQIFVDEILVEGRTDWLRPLILGMIVTTVFQGILALLRLRYLRKLFSVFWVPSGASKGLFLSQSTVKEC